MREVLRPLLPVVGAALACTAVLVLWIRAEPLDTTHTLQVVLSLGLLAALVMVLMLVLRVEREDETGGVTSA